MVVTTLKHAKAVFKRICDNPDFTLDTETVPKPPFKGVKDALVYGRMRIKIFSICRRGEAYSFPTNLIRDEYPIMQEYAELLQPYIENEAITKVMHNANYDVNVFFSSLGFARWPSIWDTMIGAWMANMAIDKGLKQRAPLYQRHLRSLFVSKEMKKKGFAGIETESDLSEYAEQDVVLADELYQMQTFGVIERPERIRSLREDGKLISVRNNLPSGKIVVPRESLNDFQKLWIFLHELPVLRATMRAERRGFPYNNKKASEIQQELERDKDQLTKELYRAAGEKINLGATQQVVKLLEKHGVVLKTLTKTGKKKLDKNVLFRLTEAHPLVAKVARYRKLEKLQSVYLGTPGDPEDLGIAYYLNPDTRRIHCTLNTIGAVTGRFSAQQPNLQQLPARADIYGIRDAFCAPKGKGLICLDYAQLEIRIMAILCKDPAMEKILNDPNGDIHNNTSKEFGVTRDPVAKNLNFLNLYGGLEYMLAEKLSSEGVPTTPEQAKVYQDRYNEVYFRVKEYRKELLAFHQENGYVPLLTGRGRWLLNVNWDNWSQKHKAETTLSNNVVQGSGQDMLKASIIRCDPQCVNPDREILQRMKMPTLHKALIQDYARKLEKLRRIFKLAKLEWILQVHDEVIYFAEFSACEEIAAHLADVMTWNHYFPAITDYNIPLVAEGGVGYTWKQAKAKKDSANPPLFKIKAGFENTERETTPMKVKPTNRLAIPSLSRPRFSFTF